jgi:hypothetical protein
MEQSPFEELTVAKLVTFLQFMEPTGSLLCSEEPTTSSNPHPLILFKSNFNIVPSVSRPVTQNSCIVGFYQLKCCPCLKMEDEPASETCASFNN